MISFHITVPSPVVDILDLHRTTQQIAAAYINVRNRIQPIIPGFYWHKNVGALKERENYAY
jgi:hypothetical protein